MVLKVMSEGGVAELPPDITTTASTGMGTGGGRERARGGREGGEEEGEQKEEGGEVEEDSEKRGEGGEEEEEGEVGGGRGEEVKRDMSDIGMMMQGVEDTECGMANTRELENLTLYKSLSLLYYSLTKCGE